MHIYFNYVFVFGRIAMIVPRLSPQGGNSYAIQKECSILPLPVNLSHVILQHVDLLLSSRNSFTNPQVSLCMLQFTMTVFMSPFLAFMQSFLIIHVCRHTCVFLAQVCDHILGLDCINKASCNCKDWIRHRFVQKCLLFWWNFIIFVLSFHRNTCKWRFPWSEVSTIKDGVDVNPPRLFPRDLCHTAVLCWIVTSTEDFNENGCWLNPSQYAHSEWLSFYVIKFKQWACLFIRFLIICLYL